MFGNESEILGTSICPLVVRGESDMSPFRELSSFCWFSSFSFSLSAASRAIDSLTLTSVSYERDLKAASSAWIFLVSFSSCSCKRRLSLFSFLNLLKYKSAIYPVRNGVKIRRSKYFTCSLHWQTGMRRKKLFNYTKFRLGNPKISHF